MTDAELAQRLRVVALTREWLGTRYQHGARIKRVCCDCTFFAKVFEEAGLIPEVNINPYASNAHLNRGSGQYLQILTQYARQVEKPQIADIAMFHIARDFSHSGVITERGWPWIIHADMTAGMVLEARGDQASLAAAKAVRFYSFWQ